MNIQIKSFEKVTSPNLGFNVFINDNEPIFVDLLDLQGANENYFMYFKDVFYYNSEIEEMIYEAINQGVINIDNFKS